MYYFICVLNKIIHKMVPKHILTSDLYKQLYKDYLEDMSFLNNVTIINYDVIKK